MSNLAAIFENREAFSLLLQAKRDLRYEMICLFSNLQTVWKHLPIEMQNESKTHILEDIVEKGLSELSHSSAVLDEQIDGLIKGYGETVRSQRQQIIDMEQDIQELREQYELLQQQTHSLENERDAANERQANIKKDMQQKIDALQRDYNIAAERGRAWEGINSKLTSLKQGLRAFATAIEEDDKKTLLRANISRQDIVSKLKVLANT